LEQRRALGWPAVVRRSIRGEAILVSALSYDPILRGFLALLIVGAVFPLNGVFILRLNLIALRFMLMHGALLGGAIALGLNLDPLVLAIVFDLALVLIIAAVSRNSSLNAGNVTIFLMVLTVGLAVIVIYRFGVTAKDTLAILWGSLFALSALDLFLTILFSIMTLLFVVTSFRRIKAVLFNRDIAFSSGIRADLYHNVILLITGITVAFCMRLIGALLLDALLLLPAIAGSLFARSMKGLFVLAALFGVLSSLSGFFLSLAVDIPVSSAVTIVASLILGIGIISRRFRKPGTKNAT